MCADEILALLSDPEIEALLVVSSEYGNTGEADEQYQLALQWLRDRTTDVCMWDDFCQAFGPPPEAAGMGFTVDCLSLRR